MNAENLYTILLLSFGFLKHASSFYIRVLNFNIKLLLPNYCLFGQKVQIHQFWPRNFARLSFENCFLCSKVIKLSPNQQQQQQQQRMQQPSQPPFISELISVTTDYKKGNIYLLPIHEISKAVYDEYFWSNKL